MKIENIISVASVIISLGALWANIYFANKSKNSEDNANRYAREANEKSEESNQLANKSIAINYDATFNDFNIQLKSNKSELIRIRESFKRFKNQNKEFFWLHRGSIIEDITVIQTQKQHMRPSEYYYHYEELESLGEDIKSQCEILEKIVKKSEDEDPIKNKIFIDNYNKTLEYFDLIIKKLEIRIDNNF